MMGGQHVGRQLVLSLWSAHAAPDRLSPIHDSTGHWNIFWSIISRGKPNVKIDFALNSMKMTNQKRRRARPDAAAELKTVRG